MITERAKATMTRMMSRDLVSNVFRCSTMAFYVIFSQDNVLWCFGVIGLVSVLSLVSICQRNCFGVLVFSDLVDWPSGGFNQGSWYFGVLVFSDLLDWPSGGFYKRSQYFGVFVFSDLVDFVCS